MTEDDRYRLEGVLALLDQANSMWPMFLGHPETGQPVEIDKDCFKFIKQILREALENDKDRC